MKQSRYVLQAPFSPSYKKYTKLIRLEAYPEAEDDARKLFDDAVQRLKPKSLYIPAYIVSREPAGDDGISLQLETESSRNVFTGKVLSELNEVYRVFPYIATCGNEMETYDLSSLDMLAPFWLDTIKTMALGAARKHLVAHFRKDRKLDNISSVNPGSGNVDIWPIEELRGIFNMLDSGDPVGVTLTPSSLMTPNKSISGIFYESGKDFTSCQYCERENCPGRKAPFGGVRL